MRQRRPSRVCLPLRRRHVPQASTLAHWGNKPNVFTNNVKTLEQLTRLKAQDTEVSARCSTRHRLAPDCCRSVEGCARLSTFSWKHAEAISNSVVLAPLRFAHGCPREKPSCSTALAFIFVVDCFPGGSQMHVF